MEEVETSIESEIRRLEISDLGAVVEIERSAYDDPWSENLLRDAMMSPLTHCRGLFVENILKVYSIFQVIQIDSHLLNIATNREDQGKGYGRQMMEWLCDFVRRKGAKSLYLEVRVTNEAAIRLYKSLNFEQLMIREKYYSNQDSALVMIKNLREENDEDPADRSNNGK